MQSVAAQLTSAKEAAAEANSEIKKGGEGTHEAAEEGLLGLGALGESLKSIAEIAGVGFGAEKSEWASEVTEAAEQVERDAAKLGVSLRQVQELQALSALTGSDYQELATIFERLQLALAKAGEGAGPLAAALKALDVNAGELKAQNPSGQLETLAAAFSRFADGPTKTAAAIAIFGKAGADLIPILDKGRAGIDELRETMERAGGVLSDESVHAFAATRESINELSLAMGNLSQDAFGGVNSAVAGLVRILADLVEDIHASATEGGFFAVAFEAIGWTLRQTAQFIGETIQGLKDLDVVGDATTQALSIAFQTFGKLVADVFGSLSAALPQFFTALVAAGQEAVGAVERQFVDLGTVISSTLHFDFSGAKAALGDMGTDAVAAGSQISGAFKGVFDFSAAQADARAGADRIAAIVADADKRIVDNALAGKHEYEAIWGAAGAARHGEGEGQNLGGSPPSRAGTCDEPLAAPVAARQ